MRDYEKLMKALRLCASNDPCMGCMFFDDRIAGDDHCDKTAMKKAADAIEELQQIVDKKERQIEYLFTLITEKDNEIDSINTCLDTYRALTEAMQGNQIPEWISKEEK